VRVLLDTHAFLWWVADSPKLSADAREIIASEDNEPIFSVVSAWEIAIKVSVGKLEIPDSPEKFVTEQLSRNDLEVLPIHLRHALQAYDLPDYHRDPFDRLLVAQTRAEDLTVLTADPLIARYPVRTVW
jgi:PIN domain nuclease of toxin-antitoxin system